MIKSESPLSDIRKQKRAFYCSTKHYPSSTVHLLISSLSIAKLKHELGNSTLVHHETTSKQIKRAT